MTPTRRQWLTGALGAVAAGCATAGPPTGRRARIVVLGAGLAGLAAAYELTGAGYDVTVLEASERPGGRVRTLRDFADGLTAEAGAIFIPDNHDLTLGYAQRFGLSLEPIGARAGGDVYFVRGVKVTAAREAAVAWPFDLTPEERRLGLVGMWQRYIGDALAALGDVTQPGWPPLELARYDAMTATEFLRSRGASDGAVALLRLGYLDLWGDGLDSYSALSMLRDWALRRAERRAFRVLGGNDRLPAAFAAALGSRIRYRAPVLAIERHARGATVRVSAGDDPASLDADAVVCALPLPLLRRVAVTPPWSPAKRAAIDGLPVTSISRVVVQFAARPWAADGGPLSLNTDLPIQFVWEPSAGRAGVRGLLETYTAGAEARRVCRLDAEARRAWALDGLTRIYPALRGLAERAVSTCWDDEPWARGAYTWFAPGQVTRLTSAIARPEGRVYFAGEHASSRPGWMQGALESGVRAAREVDGALGSGAGRGSGRRSG